MPRRLTVVAFACVPGRGSEPGAGWEAARAAILWGHKRSVSVTVVTRSLGAQEIAKKCREVPDLAEAGWQFVDLPRWLTVLLGGAATRRSFAVWQLSVFLRLRNQGPGSIVHLVTYATDSVPPVSLLVARRRDARIWGPLGSAQVGWMESTISSRLQRLWKTLILTSFARMTGLVILQNPHVLGRARSKGGNLRVRPNVVVEDLGSRVARKHYAVQLLSVGNLTRGKRVDLAVNLLRVMPRDVGLVVIGDGPERRTIEQLALDSGVAARVTFLRTLPRERVLAHMRASDMLIHLSEHESAGWVVGEALSVGTPPLVFAGSGADYLVRATDTVGGIVEFPDAKSIFEVASEVLHRGRGRVTGLWSREAWSQDMATVYDDAMAVR